VIFNLTFKDRNNLILENMALRQQLAVQNRNIGRPVCEMWIIAFPKVGGLHHLYKRVA